MTRRVKLPIREHNSDLEFLLISSISGVWESDWKALQGTVPGGLLTRVTRGVINHALCGWSRPLVDALGVPPWGALVKLPKPSRKCIRREDCPLHIEVRCRSWPVPKTRVPWCFEPDGVDAEVERKAWSWAIQEWAQGTYLVVVEEDVA